MGRQGGLVPSADCGALPAPVAPFERVRRSINAWERIGAGKVVLNWIKYGYRLPFTKRLEPFHHRPRPPVPELLEPEARIYEKLLSLGVIEHTEDDTYVSRSRLEPKKGGDFRLVVDNRHLNKHIQRVSCKYETLADLPYLLRRNDLMLSCDLENGYYQMMTSQSPQVPHHLA